MPPEMQEAEIRRSRQMVAQECRIIRDRHQHEDRYQIGHAEPPGAVAQKARWSLSHQAVPDEQSGDEKHEGHEETVVEQYDQIKAKPAHFVAAAEIGVIDDGVVKQHQQYDERSRAVQRDNAWRRDRGRIALVRLPQHRFLFHRLFRSFYERVVNDLFQRYLNAHALKWRVLHQNKKHILGAVDHEVNASGAVPFDLPERARRRRHRITGIGADAETIAKSETVAGVIEIVAG